MKEKLNCLFEDAACRIYDENIIKNHPELINNLENSVRKLVEPQISVLSEYLDN